jgi:ubiquinone/menaquinone biosynthesis C-methylase UbiE
MNEMFNPAFQTNYFQTHGPEILEMHRNNAAARMNVIEPLRRIVKNELSACGIVNISGPILEIGCGAGYFGAQLAPDSIRNRLIGIDISAESLEIARKNDPKGIFLLQDANNLQFDPSYFAGAIGYSSLDSLPDLTRVLSEIQRTVSPGMPVEFIQDCTTVLYNPFALLSAQEAVERYHSALVRACKNVGISLDFEGNVEQLSVIPRALFVSRIDRVLYPDPDPDKVLVVALDRGAMYACADSDDVDKFQDLLGIQEDLIKYVGADVVVQWARVKVVRGRV